jgi:hypothetical protein
MQKRKCAKIISISILILQKNKFKFLCVQNRELLSNLVIIINNLGIKS